MKDWGDGDSWQQFFDLYRDMIYRVALRSGLTPVEAQDAVQETLVSVAKQIGDFRYDPTLGSFKSWLLTVTRRRIVDQFRKRLPAQSAARQHNSGTSRTPTVERIPDPAESGLQKLWDSEWQDNLLAVALRRLKPRVRARQFQIFDLLITRQWPAAKVAQTLGVSLGQVYLAKHRVGGLLKREIQRLKTQPL
jgi:RNA polymerase sigma factor (sigma-70 family)